MNSNYGKKSSSFDFDLGLNKSGPKSLNDQKNKTSSSASSSSYSSYNYSAQPKPSWSQQPNKPSWTHQPAAPTQSGSASLSGPTSMVGDIFGKSWSSTGPAASGAAGIGIGKKDPNLFGDLLSSALGQNKSGSNVPLKNAAPVSNKGTFSMGGMADSLPKTRNSANSSSNWGSGGYNAGNVKNLNGNVNKGGPSLGGQPMNAPGGGLGSGMSANKDPFGSLVDNLKSKPSNSINSSGKGSTTNNSSNDNGFGGVDDAFGSFQNAPSKPSGATFPSSTFPLGTDNFVGGGTGGMGFDGFGFSNSQPQSQPSAQPSAGVNDFGSLFEPTTNPSGGAASEPFSGGDDWGFEIGGGDTGGTTTELEGLPPPPAGVTSATAKNKGVDNYKQGQYADAIKWLSWAVVLLEKAGDDVGTIEVLTCRASSYKEVGEYKKAVADCTKALGIDEKNVNILVQRALLYESMEKYKLGAEDLRTVMKLDPSNRVARSTIHRLTQMAG
ncbi:OLC1v1020584C1 [Oldenlandia corymbosa var. corymbosa]|uniref:OLC1v1020584C1 n=1 Tax=Oldenlandia corymbosa var. corymbosa TaxID=529605 RepID=A0AAV1EGT3_OLDCO|nr:OLC1v1020584C1 [Oldenlandia corymbosa var. corymbosa]